MMDHVIRSLMVISVLLVHTMFCDVEYGHHHDNQQHVHHDHVNQRFDNDALYDDEFEPEMFLGERQAEEFEALEAAEIRARLRDLFMVMDSDHDTLLDIDELVGHVVQTIEQNTVYESEEELAYQDNNGDGMVSFEEFRKHILGYRDDDLDEGYLKSLERDKMRFDLADADKDGLLNLAEFVAFDNPAESSLMHDFLIEDVVSELDRDGDGLIDFTNEFEIDHLDTDGFRQYDANSDGRLDMDELRSWLIPDHHSDASRGVKALMLKADKNGDRKLSVEELVAQWQIFSDSDDYYSHEEL